MQKHSVERDRTDGADRDHALRHGFAELLALARHDGEVAHAQAGLRRNFRVLKRDRQVVGGHERDVEDDLALARVRVEGGGVCQPIDAGGDEADLLGDLRALEFVTAHVGEHTAGVPDRVCEAPLIHELQMIAHLSLAQLNPQRLEVAADGARSQRFVTAGEHPQYCEHLAAHVAIIAERLSGGGLH